MKILIAEDDSVSRALLQSILTPYGTCHIALDGCEAIEKFKTALKEKEYYDLICLDIMMPNMDGHQVLHHIRQLEDDNGIHGLAGVKIIMITALDDPWTIMKAFREQCEDYVIKPIKKDSILEKIKKLGLIK